MYGKLLFVCALAKQLTQKQDTIINILRTDGLLIITDRMDDSAKRDGQPTSELSTVILCDPNFAVS